jgi:hypothetical protein
LHDLRPGNGMCGKLAELRKADAAAAAARKADGD